MLKLVNNIEGNREGKHLKFPIASHPKAPYKHHIVIRVDTDTDVNFFLKYNFMYAPMRYRILEIKFNTISFQYHFISIPGQFHIHLEFRSEKYLNTFIVTNANDCPNLLSYGNVFRMGVLLPNYPQEIVVKGDSVLHFSKMNGGKTGNGTLNGTLNGISYVNTGNGTVNGTLNVFQILNDIQKRQRAVQCQYNSSTIPTVPEMATPFRTTTPPTPVMTTVTAKQADPAHLNVWGIQNTSWSGSPASGAHVHKPPQQVLKPRDSLALRKSSTNTMEGLL